MKCLVVFTALCLVTVNSLAIGKDILHTLRICPIVDCIQIQCLETGLSTKQTHFEFNGMKCPGCPTCSTMTLIDMKRDVALPTKNPFSEWLMMCPIPMCKSPGYCNPWELIQHYFNVDGIKCPACTSCPSDLKTNLV